MELNNIYKVFFLGIGGIGMSALARWFKSEGKEVYGYDKTVTPLTKTLESEGFGIVYKDDVDLIPGDLDLNNTLVVYTPAIPRGQNLLSHFRDKSYELLKRSEVLGLITKKHKTIGVAGTHGKTTTSTMLAHLLKHAGRNVLAFLGGISKNYESNFLLNDPNKEVIVVVEADEFDRTFLRLHPDMAIITSSDPDHLDVYTSEKQFTEGFEEFAKLLPSEGLLVTHENVDASIVESAKCKALEYGQGKNDVTLSNIQVQNGEQTFDFVAGSEKISGLQLPVPGVHNLLNCTSAIAIARSLGLTQQEIEAGVVSFRGVKRRFEYIYKDDDLVFIDDYAHHPTEISAFINGVKGLYPFRKLTIVFQPHLFSRTRDFMDGFAESLALADEILLLDIYPARELPMAGITSEILFEKIKHPNKKMCSKEEAISLLGAKDSGVIATLGAGDIDQIIIPIKQQLEKVNV